MKQFNNNWYSRSSLVTTAASSANWKHISDFLILFYQLIRIILAGTLRTQLCARRHKICFHKPCLQPRMCRWGWALCPPNIFKFARNFIKSKPGCLTLLFPFPSGAKIDKLMLSEFACYPSTRIIIDYAESVIQVPSSMRAQTQTWSEYKHHNTWKVLTGISPNGAIIFASKLWPGRVCNNELIQKCGVLALMELGDSITADQRFDIYELLPPGVSSNIAPFKGTWHQLTPAEAGETTHFTSVRIHVERAISRV